MLWQVKNCVLQIQRNLIDKKKVTQLPAAHPDTQAVLKKMKTTNTKKCTVIILMLIL